MILTISSCEFINRKSQLTNSPSNYQYIINQRDNLKRSLVLLEDSLENLQEENSKVALNKVITERKKKISEFDFLIQKIELEEEQLRNQQFLIYIWLLLGIIVLLLISVTVMLFLKKEKDKKKALEAELNILKHNLLKRQLNPHFLYNALNSVQYYILRNNKRDSSEYISLLSQLIRMILEKSQLNVITVMEELQTLKIYLSLESMRFENKLSYSIKCSDSAGNCKIPPSLLQPFVENAIWHGILHKSGPGRIDIIITESCGILKIIISDNGIGVRKSTELNKTNLLKKESMGIMLCKKRIELFNQAYQTQVGQVNIFPIDELQEETGTCVEINLLSIY